MTREEFRDYVDFLRSQDEISYDVYSELIDGIDTLEQEPYDDAKYHEEHGEVVVDKAVWEDAKRALEQITKIADIVDGTIDHFDRDDAMDVLYEIKGVIR